MLFQEKETYLGMVLNEYNGSKYGAYLLTKHILSVLFASHTNTAATLGWGITMLARNPQLL